MQNQGKDLCMSDVHITWCRCSTFKGTFINDIQIVRAFTPTFTPLSKFGTLFLTWCSNSGTPFTYIRTLFMDDLLWLFRCKHNTTAQCVEIFLNIKHFLKWATQISNFTDFDNWPNFHTFLKSAPRYMCSLLPKC